MPQVKVAIFLFWYVVLTAIIRLVSSWITDHKWLTDAMPRSTSLKMEAASSAEMLVCTYLPNRASRPRKKQVWYLWVGWNIQY